MALVEFIEKNRRDTAQVRVLNQLAEKNSFGDETDARPRRGDVFEPDLVADLIAEPASAFGRDARCEQSRGETARLEDDDLSVAKEAVIEENLRDLGGFSRAGRGLDDEAGMNAEIFYDRRFEFKDRQIFAGDKSGGARNRGD